MNLKKLTLDNFGLYRGTVTFDLLPQQDGGRTRPIILFGGQNGAGKTTIFDAFRVVLYGKAALGAKVAESEYKEYLNSRIHKSSDRLLQPRSAYIELEFEHITLSEPTVYVFRRAWELVNSKKIIEKLYIAQNEDPKRNVSPEYWQGLVEEVIPQRIASLFFFDGEKIMDIAEDNQSNMALAESIKTLLGIDVIDRLHSDLEIYKIKETQKIGSKTQKKEIESLKRELDEADENFEKVTLELASNQSQLDNVSNEIRKAEAKLKQEGHYFAQERDKHIARRSQVEIELEMVRNSITKEYEGLYPFSLCPDLANNLQNQLLAEKEQNKASLLRSSFESLEKQIFVAIGGLNELQDKASKAVCFMISKVIQENLTSSTPPDSYNNLHSLSNFDMSQILTWIEEATLRSGQMVHNLQLREDDLIHELHEILAALQKIPSNSVLEPLIQKLNELNAKRGFLTQQRQTLETNRNTIKRAREDAKRKLENICAKIAAFNDASARITQADKVQRALVEYTRRLTRAKVEELGTVARDCFNRLSRKGDRIAEMTINPETFSVVLKDKFKNTLPKEELSAGEKQVYAIAILWGLSIISGRSLPIIIDTPLGRLDSEHRQNLVSKYFPKAADQIILLSTDTEIDKKWYFELYPWISRSYLLVNNLERNCTEVKPTYFWMN